MPRQVFEYDPPDRFVAGTVGQPGHRTFYLQAAGDGRTTSVALEKQQVAALAERVEELLDEVVRRSGGTASVPAVARADSQDLEPLATPVDEEFRVGTMSLAWDPDSERVLIECFDVETGGDDEDDTDDGTDDDPAEQPGGAPSSLGTDEDLPDSGETEETLTAEELEEAVEALEDSQSVLRVSLTGVAARAFARRALAVVASGRPPCPFCGGPLDPDGHLCPRANGYKR
jgi:uncharacterized repeat protein (TIGR03847 family)